MTSMTCSVLCVFKFSTFVADKTDVNLVWLILSLKTHVVLIEVFKQERDTPHEILPRFTPGISLLTCIYARHEAILS